MWWMIIYAVTCYQLETYEIFILEMLSPTKSSFIINYQPYL